jgi:mono/diheme cytochrome c family protein
LLLALDAGGCGKSSAAASPADGARLFAATCARCHGPGGGGGVAAGAGLPPPRNFLDPIFQLARTDDDLRYAITRGKGPGMPPFGAVLSAREIEALVAHVRSLDPRRK